MCPRGLHLCLFVSCLKQYGIITEMIPGCSYVKDKDNHQRWSPRGRPWPRRHIIKSLTLASKPQVLNNCPVLGSRTALLFEWLKFCRSVEKCFFRPYCLEIDGKNFFKTFFLRKTLAFDSLVLGLGLEHSCPWPRILFVSLALASSLVSSTPPLTIMHFR